MKHSREKEKEDIVLLYEASKIGKAVKYMKRAFLSIALMPVISLFILMLGSSNCKNADTHYVGCTIIGHDVSGIITSLAWGCGPLLFFVLIACFVVDSLAFIAYRVASK